MFGQIQAWRSDLALRRTDSCRQVVTSMQLVLTPLSELHSNASNYLEHSNRLALVDNLNDTLT